MPKLFALVLSFACTNALAGAAPRDRLKVPDLVPSLLANEVSVLPVRDNIYMLTTSAGNMTVQVGNDGVLLVDTLDGRMGDQVIAAIRKLTGKPIHYIVNTSAEAEHIGGNAHLAQVGSPPGIPAADPRTANVVAHEKSANRMLRPTGDQLVIDSAGWPLVTYFAASFDFFFNGTPIQLIHVPNARSDGDSMIVFRRTDVVSAGDVFATDRYPVIRPERGGSLAGTIAALESLLAITIPEMLQEGGTLVIPGHGRLSDEGDVVEYRDMLVIVRDRLRDLIQQGKTLEQVLAMQPTLDYDGLYGNDSGPWTTTMFIAAAYEELSAK